MIRFHLYTILAIVGLLLSACDTPFSLQPYSGNPPVLPLSGATAADTGGIATPLPTRPNYTPGQLVDYIAQSGDTLPALAARFNTTIAEIMAANPVIPADATTMPPGFPMKIPIYFRSLWASPFKIMPDAAFVNGPAGIGFNTSAFVAEHQGWLSGYRAFVGGANGAWRTGAEMVDYVATNYSVSPRLLLAILEYQTGALSQPEPPSPSYMLGFRQLYYGTPYLQLVIAANTLNNGYYGWRSGLQIEFDEPDGTILRPDPWQNAASVGIQYYFSRLYSGDKYDAAVGPGGLAKTYQSLFGNPWNYDLNFIPGSLRQPAFSLPFSSGQVWTYTGGPHPGWGAGEPFSALDFAPPCDHPGCANLDPRDYVVAMAGGLVVRSGLDGVLLDLDGDGDERTGWDILYLHLAGGTRPPVGKQLQAGEMIGYPSSEGGEATGTHVHIARKYNGEWILASGVIPFNFDGWIAHAGSAAYMGTLTRNGLTVTACACSDLYSEIKSDLAP